uniref:NADPH:adrenodoxin oxidoreductase, mitochondrial n=1 Tax=Ascaris lumbricoides TaxID=6252 RepID=A0A0M3HUK8_ASCLU
MMRTVWRMKRLLTFARRCLATFERAPRIAVVGSGPGGMYVCAGVLRRLPQCEVDIVECNAVPYGLIRYGVAPDHPEVKNCINRFDRMFTANADRLRLFCNVCVGRDITFSELCADYDAVVLAYGARRQRRLVVPGVTSRNVFSGGDFVSWYNAVPGAQQPNLNCESAVVIGVGNVALDCCRILLSSGEKRLAQSDIPSEILKHLAQSKVSTVTIVARRGPLDVSFTIKELREQIVMPGCSFAMELSDIDQKTINESLDSLPRPRKRLIELMMKNWNRDAQRKARHCQLLFRRAPTEVIADDAGWVKAVRTRNSQSGAVEDLPCGLLIYSLGYENVLLDGVPKNDDGRIKMRDSVRVHTNGETLVYACGWCAHAPRGTISDTQVDSANVAAALCSDVQLKGVKPNVESCLSERLRLKGVRFTTWQEWKAIDEREVQLGKGHGKEREKIMDFEIPSKNGQLDGAKQ